jgi:hypothetical protein
MSETAFAALLELFPAHTHALTLVSDPDGLLDELRAVLMQRGFQYIPGEDPIRLRLELRQREPPTSERPIIVVIRGELNSLPYDLWQQGRRVNVNLATCWPGLAGTVLRMLTPGQRRLLGKSISRGESGPLSVRETQDVVLRQLVGFVPEQMTTHAALVCWLAAYHAGTERLPDALLGYIREQLRGKAAFDSWPLEQLLESAASLQSWVQQSWEAYLAQASTSQQAVSSASMLREPSAQLNEQRHQYAPESALQFASDLALQDALGVLVRYGALRPVAIESQELDRYESWMRPGLIVADVQIWETHFNTALTVVESMLSAGIKDWQGWQRCALHWARLALLRYKLEGALPLALNERYMQVERELDNAFFSWLAAYYAPLAGRGLPVPHHLFHLPAKLARDLRQSPQTRVALLILDGLSLADWQLIGPVWRSRHPDWQMEEACILAQVPSITAVSRQALISGMRPNALTRSLIEQPREERAWKAFWQQQSLSPEGASYVYLSDVIGADYPVALITNRRTRALCLISTVIDHMVHGATQGTAGLYAALAVWLGSGSNTQPTEAMGARQQGSAWMEGLIDFLLAEGYTITLTGDHGHVEALGVGNPQEGVLASTRSKRTRVYSSPELARSAASRLSDTIAIEESWLRPQGMFPVVAERRTAYAAQGERVVTHGGLTVEEMIVPFITLKRPRGRG